MSHQEQLESLLKKKGIGPEGSKSLNQEELSEVSRLLINTEVSLTTKATLLTALLLLEPNEHEKEWVNKVKENPKQMLPAELEGFILENSNPFLTIIKKLISKIELSKEECISGMKFLFDSSTPEYLKGPFLEGERLKRESFTENLTFFNYMFDKIQHVNFNHPILIEICDSYDGSNRSKNYAVFTASLLSSIGYKVLVQGIDEVAPKLGITSHKILKAANKNPLITIDSALINLNKSDIGWAYIDQQIFFPELYKLKNLRKEMVKRPFLATFEKLLQPIKSKNGNFIVTGYTHPHYKEELVKQLKQQGKCQQALILKGVEGSTHMSLSKNTTAVLYNGKDISETTIHPENFNLPHLDARQDKSINEFDSLNEGVAALNGEKNYARENILYLAIAILTQFQLESSETAFIKLTKSLESGKAFSHWIKANN
jgi:anthranilate phosphoribosyltransferase